jgi:hypothetical protein
MRHLMQAFEVFICEDFADLARVWGEDDNSFVRFGCGWIGWHEQMLSFGISRGDVGDWLCYFTPLWGTWVGFLLPGNALTAIFGVAVIFAQTGAFEPCLTQMNIYAGSYAKRQT